MKSGSLARPPSGVSDETGVTVQNTLSIEMTAISMEKQEFRWWRGPTQLSLASRDVPLRKISEPVPSACSPGPTEAQKEAQVTLSLPRFSCLGAKAGQSAASHAQWLICQHSEDYSWRYKWMSLFEPQEHSSPNMNHCANPARYCVPCGLYYLFRARGRKQWYI